MTGEAEVAQELDEACEAVQGVGLSEADVRATGESIARAQRESGVPMIAILRLRTALTRQGKDPSGAISERFRVPFSEAPARVRGKKWRRR